MGAVSSEECEQGDPSGSKGASSITFEQLKSLHGRDFLVKSIAYYSDLFIEAIGKYGVDLSDYAPYKLKMIDQHFFESAKEACLGEGIPLEEGILLAVYHAVGSYFGVVIVRNLGGAWRHPSILRFWLSRLLGRPTLLFDHWYVVAKGKRIPVFKIARWRCDGSGRVLSLTEVYGRIAAGREWDDTNSK